MEKAEKERKGRKVSDSFEKNSVGDLCGHNHTVCLGYVSVFLLELGGAVQWLLDGLSQNCTSDGRLF